MTADKVFTIAIAGNPNCGKTALFNALTGSRQSVGNWPGVTVEKKEGHFELGRRHIRVVDLPGTYALFANAEDERAAVDFLLSREADLIVNIVDATNLERNLFLTSQLADMGIPMAIAVNMMDIAERRGLRIDLDRISAEYGVPCIPLTAVDEKSVANFVGEMAHVLAKAPAAVPKPQVYGEKVEAAVKALEPRVAPVAKLLGADARWVALMRLGNDKSYADKFAEAGVEIDKSGITALLGEESEFAMADERYSKAHALAREAIGGERSRRTRSDRIDAVLLNRWAALPIFLVVMYLVFWIAVTIGSAFIDFFDILFGAVFVDGFAALLESVHAPAWAVSVLADGVGAGIQTVSTFIPVIFFMFLCLSFLEDSGYMARAAFVADRFMRFLGLPGRAFVPMMVGFGCGVPGIMGSRVLESKRERFLTIFLVPFMSCGARLPVYALFAAAFFGKSAGTVVFALYLAGVLFAVAYGLFLKRSLFQGQASNFVMELPPYHLPKFKGLMIHCWQKLRDYIWRAGKVITVAVAVLGFLNSFGVAERAGDGAEGGSSGFEFTAGNGDSENSLLSVIGKAITPVFEPFGVEKENWPASVSLFTGLLAKEAVIGTMNSLYAMAGNGGESGAAAPAEEPAPAESAVAPDSAAGETDAAAAEAEPAAEERELIAGVDECPEDEEEEEEGVDLLGALVEALRSVPENLGEVVGSLTDILGTSGELEAQEAADLKLATLEKIEGAKAVTCGEYAALSSFEEGEEAERLRAGAFEKLKAAGVELSEDEMAALEEGDLSETSDIYANLRSYFHNPDKDGNPVDGFNWQVFAFLVFILLYVPCLAAMGVVAREIGLGLAVLMATVQTVLAWAVSILIYQIPVGGDVFWIVAALAALVATGIFLKLFGMDANRKKRFED
ncbi:MAG: ferrous iron transport protein B [Fibrobacterales bacterium]|nr:ferrous iron transport protein B [Fibrobacterales bacterium]